MSVKLQNDSDVKFIDVGDMQDGQLAIIASCPSVRSYEGRVVQRIGDKVYTVGGTKGGAWSLPGPSYKVRLLEPGELIEVIEN